MIDINQVASFKNTHKFSGSKKELSEILEGYTICILNQAGAHSYGLPGDLFKVVEVVSMYAASTSCVLKGYKIINGLQSERPYTGNNLRFENFGLFPMDLKKTLILHKNKLQKSIDSLSKTINELILLKNVKTKKLS